MTDFNPDYLVPGTRIGGYVVRGMLGQGGSSSVYEVESAEGHRFALKICRYHGSAAYRTSEWRVDQRYSRSVICLQLLKGRRNVAELYAHDRYPDPLHGYQYLVQELVPDSLLITDWVKRESPTLRKLIGAFVELAELCGVMASKGICHRDLKPPNILVTPDGTPKVIDFESATCSHVEPVTRREASAVPGTGGWQCPELCQAILEEQSKKKSKEPFDFLPWGDLFSLGVVFYECLTGEHPFDISLPDELLLEEIAFETPIQPMRISTAVPLGLNKVVMKLLEKEPEARYRDGAEVAEDLGKLLENVKDERWEKPLKHPVPHGELAPVLSLVSPLVPPESPVPVIEKESEGPVPDTPPSEPKSRDAEISREAAQSEKPPDATPHSADSVDTDVVLPDEADTAEPRGVPESVPAVGTVLDLGKAGTYTLEQRLGRGGMGEVYLARQVGAAGVVQSVAIKRVRPGLRPLEERFFVDEARLLSRLRHENIARVYAFHEWQGSFYLVMEYVEGHSLHALLELARRKGHRFSEPVACAVMAEVAHALGYAHQAQDAAGQPLHIVHRDVSPTNILIANTGRVVLVDFGVAFNTQEGRIATGAGSTIIKGKWPYVSPEQVKHQPLDGRSDLFSVGTILMELLTGEPPFGWAGDSATLLRIAKVTPEYVASRLSGVSKPLRALCQKLLAVRPDERFATGRDVAMALRRHARLYEGPEAIRAEVERLQALPDVKAPPAAGATARALSEVKRARRTVALAGASMLATLVLASWYVPRHAAPVLSSPSQQGPAVSLSLPPEKSMAPAAPVPPPNGRLVGKLKGEDGAAVAARPDHRRKVAVVAPPSDLVRAAEPNAPPSAVLADENPPPAERWTDGAVLHVARDSDEATGARSVEIAQDANNEEAEALAAEARREGSVVLSVDDALAALLVRNQVDLTPFRRVELWKHQGEEANVEIEILARKPKKAKSEAGKGKVAVVFNVTNKGLALPWELQAIRLTTSNGSQSWPYAFRSVVQAIPQGATGRVVVVMDLSAYDPVMEGERLVLDLFRSGGYLQASVALNAREFINR